MMLRARPGGAPSVEILDEEESLVILCRVSGGCDIFWPARAGLSRSNASLLTGKARTSVNPDYCCERRSGIAEVSDLMVSRGARRDHVTTNPIAEIASRNGAEGALRWCTTPSGVHCDSPYSHRQHEVTAVRQMFL